ncbi:5-bromo-4-chloroindolyl phosphate hydrolysis family protein [Rhodovulum sp. DZ06]|uniref:5-bromo-4-chloroindolyl phosphate hydrolysis family protein n=1 Tax=Rhodovulum sp. DZ06 TaxID=3425126 RepID=UPI003D331A14
MSGKRFGGTFSPGAAGAGPPGPAPAPREKPRVPRFWPLMLFLAPAPLLFSIYGEILRAAPLGAAEEIGFGALLLLGAEMLREGLKAEAAWMARADAARPPIPRKILAALLCGIGVGGLSVFAAGHGMAAGGGLGLLALALHILAFGIDPLKNKGAAGEARRADAALAKAEETIAETLAAARRLGDESLAARVESLIARARPVLAQIEEDPRDLPRARRFLSVTLQGARDATVKYARLGVADAELRAAYVALLTQLERSFDQQRDRLAAEDRTELEVEIEVLSERLRRDGIEAGR